jgi:hypothetical protein
LAALKTLIGWLSVLFHLLFSLLLTGLGSLAVAFGPQALRLEMLPWTGFTLAHVLLFGGLFGLVSVVLAMLDKLRFVFLLWTLAVALVLSKGMIFSGYRFPPGHWQRPVYVLGAAWFAVLGAAFLMRSKPAPGPRKYLVK